MYLQRVCLNLYIEHYRLPDVPWRFFNWKCFSAGNINELKRMTHSMYSYQSVYYGYKKYLMYVNVT